MLAAALLTGGATAWAQLPIGTLAGRQLGDGRAATAASLDRPFGVTFAADGGLLIADRLHSRIRRVDPASGLISTIVGSVPGGRNNVVADQGELVGPLRVRIEPTTGDLLIPDFDAHTIRRVVVATGAITRIAGSMDVPGATGDGDEATAALLNGPADAVADGSGGILIADRNNHVIRRIDLDGDIDRVAGNGTAGYSGDGVPGGATSAQLNLPSCVLPIAPEDGGGFFVCDQENHAIRRVSSDGTITTVVGTGLPGLTDGPVATAQLHGPAEVAFDADGNLLIADEDNNAIRRFDLGANVLSTLAGTGPNQFTPDGSPAAGSPLAGPTSIVLAPDGRIVFGEDESHRVRAIDAAGNLVTLAGDGVNRFGGDGGPPLDAQFDEIKSITRDLADRLIITDDGNARIRRFDPCSGVLETIAGTGSRAFGGDGGPALEAGLTASDAVVDANGNIVFSDADNHRVRMIDVTGTITTIVGTGVPAFSGDDGLATAAEIHRPTGLTFDTAGSLYIADFGNNAIRKVTNGMITTVAGTGAAGFNGDDIPATSAQLNNPTDMIVDAAGNLYIADFENHRVRRVDAVTGIITTVAGTGVAGDTGDAGPATLAQLNNPSDVQLDETGALWVADLANHRIRRFTLGGSIEGVAGNGLRGYAGDGGDARDARLLFPIRMDVLASNQVLFADRDNFVVRSLGTVVTDCSKVSDDCRGSAAATCIPGGGKLERDCFGEFKLKTALPSALPPPRILCADGDPACDADDSLGQCTFRVSLCLNNEDTRIPCSPGNTTSLKLNGMLAMSEAGQAMLTAVRALAPSSSANKGRGVVFVSAFGDRNQCTPFSEFVVVRKRKNGKGKLGLVVKTQAGKDKDKLKLICLAP